MKQGISLKKLNTFNVDAQCNEIHYIRQESDLQQFFGYKESQFYILGGGSNVLLIDPIDRIIIKNEITGKEIIHEDSDHVIVRVGGGENWHEFVEWSIDQGYSGIENLSLIPGTVGAAPVQNIGAYGVELEEVFVRLEGILMDEGKPLGINKSACRFGYRDSIFKHELKGRFFISHVHLRLNKSFAPRLDYGAIRDIVAHNQITIPTAKEVSKAVCEIRKSKLPDPSILGNAGSFFKNPLVDSNKLNELKLYNASIPHFLHEDSNYKIPAGWLIEQAGWKGKRVGDVSTYDKQALVIVQFGNSTGMEIYTYAQNIIEDVKAKFGIQLSMEVNIWK